MRRYVMPRLLAVAFVLAGTPAHFVMAAGGVGAGTVSSVRSDNVAGGRAVARHLADTGHQRVAYIAGHEESSTNLERERGFRDGLAERGLRIWARGVGNYDFE